MRRGRIPSSIVAGDFTGNGVLDLAVANPDSDDVSILLGDGHGGFHDTPPDPARRPGEPSRCPSWRATSRATACSTWPSLNQGTDNVSILQGDGQGGFQALPPISLATTR